MVQTGFYLLPLIMISSVLYMIQKAPVGETALKTKTSFTFLAWIVAWVAYLNFLSLKGLLNDFGLPPRVPLFIILPAIGFIFLFVTRSATRKIIHAGSKVFPVYIQSFRIVVELLIYGAFVNGVFPKAVTFEGINFDIVVGITAPFIAFLYQRDKISNRGLLIWNIASLCILTLTAYSFIFSFYFEGPVNENMARFIQMPYLLLAGTLLPCAIFYHTVSIKQMLSG